MRFIINKPSVWMYKNEDLCGEVSDELLFGTVIEIISENDTCVYCRTDYGYCGYINKWELCECETADCGISGYRYIYNRCDVLNCPEYKYAPVMSLSKGARIKIISQYDNRFSVCDIGKKKYYISNNAFVRRYGSGFPDGFIAAADSYVGTPYRWGGKSDYGIDCSGLAFMCASLCGKQLYRDAVPKEEYLYIKNCCEIQKGDLIYFKGHVAVYAGNGEIIHSSGRAGCVVRIPFEESGLTKGDIVCCGTIK